MSKRVLLAGLFHETHTFLEGTTSWDEFEVRRGDELLSAEGDGSPLGGALEIARESNWDVVPAIDIRATPSAIVADEVIERFWRELKAAAEQHATGKLDGIFLVLHGAMVSQSYEDVEGEILERLRSTTFGSSVPLGGVLDLHANFSERMARHADALIAYRENPHTDAEESARRAARLLDRLIRTDERPTTLWRRPPVIWPPTGVATLAEPMRTLERMAREIEQEHPEILAVNVLAGFAFADTSDTGVCFSGLTIGDPAVLDRALGKLESWAFEHRELGNVRDAPIESVMPQVLSHAEGPVLLVEPSDNIGGGAPGDGTGILRALLKHDVKNAAVVINDPAAAARCHAATLGSPLQLAIGSWTSRSFGNPLDLEVEVVSLSDGRFTLEDRQSHLASMYGVRIDMGPCAVVRHRGIRILLTTHKTPPFDLGQFRSQGLVPELLAVIGVKAAVAHRRAYDPIAKASYTVDTPGPCSSNLCQLPFRRVRRPVYPLDDSLSTGR